mmetsp:Transcript_2184/g.14502  ORF Transcript_2184/g.14502 Transcript_2184/m.14502 type:complete len:215 (-) Transcript_2184:2337-2981(-)
MGHRQSHGTSRCESGGGHVGAGVEHLRDVLATRQVRRVQEVARRIAVRAGGSVSIGCRIRHHGRRAGRRQKQQKVRQIRSMDGLGSGRKDQRRLRWIGHPRPFLGQWTRGLQTAAGNLQEWIPGSHLCVFLLLRVLAATHGTHHATRECRHVTHLHSIRTNHTRIRRWNELCQSCARVGHSRAGLRSRQEMGGACEHHLGGTARKPCCQSNRIH